MFKAILKHFQRIFIFSAGGGVPLEKNTTTGANTTTTTGANSLKMLQNGLKHGEKTKKTTGKQDKSVLFTEDQILRI